MPKRRGSPVVSVESRILFLRHHRVILDTDLARLYSVSVKRLNEQVKRNEKRFPPDFMFQLTAKEEIVLRSQTATSKRWQWWAAVLTVCLHRAWRGHGRYSPQIRARCPDESVRRTRLRAIAGDTGDQPSHRIQDSRVGRPPGVSRRHYFGHHLRAKGTYQSNEKRAPPDWISRRREQSRCVELSSTLRRTIPRVFEVAICDLKMMTGHSQSTRSICAFCSLSE